MLDHDRFSTCISVVSINYGGSSSTNRKCIKMSFLGSLWKERVSSPQKLEKAGWQLSTACLLHYNSTIYYAITDGDDDNDCGAAHSGDYVKDLPSASVT